MPEGQRQPASGGLRRAHTNEVRPRPRPRLDLDEGFDLRARKTRSANLAHRTLNVGRNMITGITVGIQRFRGKGPQEAERKARQDELDQFLGGDDMFRPTVVGARRSTPSSSLLWERRRMGPGDGRLERMRPLDTSLADITVPADEPETGPPLFSPQPLSSAKLKMIHDWLDKSHGDDIDQEEDFVVVDADVEAEEKESTEGWFLTDSDSSGPKSLSSSERLAFATAHPPAYGPHQPFPEQSPPKPRFSAPLVRSRKEVEAWCQGLPTVKSGKPVLVVPSGTTALNAQRAGLVVMLPRTSADNYRARVMGSRAGVKQV